MRSVFYRVTQIEDEMRISVHIGSDADIQSLLAQRTELHIQQEDENEWFIGCSVLGKRGGR